MPKQSQKRRTSKATAAPESSDSPVKAEVASKNVKFDLGAYRKELAQQAGVGVVSVNYLASLLALKPTKVAPWEKRGVVPAELAYKLAELEKLVKAGETKLEPPKRGRRAGSAPKAKVTRTARKVKALAPEPIVSRSDVSVDVKALRTKMGLSRAKFAKRLGGAAVGSIANWESKKSVPRAKYAGKLRELAAEVASGAAVPATRSAATSARARSGNGSSGASAPADLQTLARMIFEAAVGCSDATRTKLFDAAAALLAEK